MTDGVEFVEGERILLRGQPYRRVRAWRWAVNVWRKWRGKPPRNWDCNGIYTVTSIGSAAAPRTIPAASPPKPPKRIVLSQEAADMIAEGIRRDFEEHRSGDGS